MRTADIKPYPFKAVRQRPVAHNKILRLFKAFTNAQMANADSTDVPPHDRTVQVLGPEQRDGDRMWALFCHRADLTSVRVVVNVRVVPRHVRFSSRTSDASYSKVHAF